MLFTNSGSESNELPLRIARQHAGHTGILVTDFSYHGSTAALAELSLDEVDFRVSPRYPDLPRPRSSQVVMIECLLSSGTPDTRKRVLLAAIVSRLQAAGTEPDDVMVFFGEVDRARSSFGGGRLAPPVDVQTTTSRPEPSGPC